MYAYKRLIILVTAVLTTLTGLAQQKAIVFDDVAIGSPYEDVAEALTVRYGNPATKTEDQIVYRKKIFQQFLYDVLIFNFRQGKLSEARLYANEPSFAVAQKEMEKIAKVIDKTWPLSKDREGRYTWFYVGGIAPSGIGHLLALHTYKVGKGYHTELRFGPF